MPPKKHRKRPVSPAPSAAERIVKLYAKAARARLNWSGKEAQLFIRMACGYGINDKSSELKAATLDKGHVADLIEEANTHRRLLGMKKQGSLQDTLPLPCRMRHAVHVCRLSDREHKWRLPADNVLRQPRWVTEVAMRAVRDGFRKMLEQPSRPSTDARLDRLVIVDEFRTTRAPPWGRWLDWDTNPCLNFQRIGESMLRPLELCSYEGVEALPPIGKEYQQRYKLVNDRLPKGMQWLHRAAEYRH
ncbi:hypothetical protein QJQ45_012457 [Haematococcus lacustris]|nr:hypothetical protein QJQ45_012457 [Haematococcus lacustris]